MIGRKGLHIFMTADAVGGVWQYSCDLSSALASLGHRVTIALLGPEPSEAQRGELLSHPSIHLIETGLALDWLCTGPAPVKQAAAQVARLARKERADIIHCNMPTLAGAAKFSAPVVAVTHGCVATWWDAAKEEPLADAYRWHEAMMAEGLAAADQIVAPSASYAERVRAHYALDAMPQVVWNGRRPISQPSDVAPVDEVLTVGRLWDDVKNAALLDRVAQGVPVPFHAAGCVKGPHGETISLRNLSILGQLSEEELGARLRRRPVFVSAARFEPFGLAVLEAASAGCPLILSDIPTFRELWSDAALFVSPDDEAGYAAAIAALRTDAALREQLSKAAAARASRYTPAAMARRMMPIYRACETQRAAA